MIQRNVFLRLFTTQLFCGLLRYHITINGFTPSPPSLTTHYTIRHNTCLAPIILRSQLNNDDLQDINQPQIKALTTEEPELKLQSDTPPEPTTPQKKLAKTNTVNERLLAEAAAAAATEKSPKTSTGARFKNAFVYNKELTDAQREANLEAARDLNGVNPVVTTLGSFFAFGVAYALWQGTQWLGVVFLEHPVGPDAPYAFIRAASVVRNGVMGIASLASGFFFVTGLGIFALGIRVGWGVFTGELDPTPIKRSPIAGVGKDNGEKELPNVWDLMMNKKPTRKGGRRSGGSDNNPFGL